MPLEINAPGPWVDALGEFTEPKEQQRVRLMIAGTVERSFDAGQAPMRQITRAEIKRRLDLTARLFKTLRGDKRWGLQRIQDALPRYLRCELLGIPWVPDERRMWMPGDGR